MGMSTHVVGFRPADEQWHKMKAACDACKAANINPPIAVDEFFNYEYPGDNPGKEVDLGSAIRKWNDISRSGFEIDIAELPAGVQYIRFYNSW